MFFCWQFSKSSDVKFTQTAWLDPINKKITENFQEIGQIFCFQEILTDFQIVFLKKISGNFFQESVQLAEPKNLARKFSGFPEKNCRFKIFWFSRKCFFFSKKFSDLRIYVYRIKPWPSLLLRLSYLNCHIYPYTCHHPANSIIPVFIHLNLII